MNFNKLWSFKIKPSLALEKSRGKESVVQTPLLHATPIGAAVCHLVNIIVVLLTVISSVQRHDHWVITGGFINYCALQHTKSLKKFSEVKA